MQPGLNLGTHVLQQGVAALSLAVAAAWLPQPAQAQPSATVRPAPVVPEEGVRWQDLNAGQRGALKPLERDWAGIGADRKQKWLEVAARFPAMSPEERERIQVRMSEWAKLSPIERGQARLNYQQAKQLPAEDRQARWESYQALSPEQKNELAARAASKSASSVPVRKLPQASTARSGGDATGAPPPKSNIVPNPALAAPPKPIAPTVVRAQAGATTSLISSKPPAPPAHQQTGLPKIAATPQFVDKATLLPQRGPQAAAARPAAASSASPSRP